MALEAQAADDYGVTQIRLEVARGSELEFRTAKTWSVGLDKEGKPANAATIRHTLELPDADFKMGDALRYRFVTTDTRDLREIEAADGGGGPQSTAGQIFTISLNDVAAAAARSTKTWDDLRARLSAILQQQITLRKQANDLVAGIDAGAMRSVTSPIQSGQKRIRDDISGIAKDFPFEPSMKLVQKSLEVLATGDAAQAVECTADILLLSDSKGLPSLANRLRQNQNRIIDVLQTLLAVAAADKERIARAADHEGGDPPAEARDSWKKLAEQLKDFQKEQRAVIDATAELAKKPKGNYDDKDNKKIDDLAAIEDKWEKFLNQRLADMSKLAEQDQANGHCWRNSSR